MYAAAGHGLAATREGKGLCMEASSILFTGLSLIVRYMQAQRHIRSDPSCRCSFAQVAAAEMARFLADKRTFEALHRQYSALHYAAQQAGARARA